MKFMEFFTRPRFSLLSWVIYLLLIAGLIYLFLDRQNVVLRTRLTISQNERAALQTQALFNRARLPAAYEPLIVEFEKIGYKINRQEKLIVQSDSTAK